MTGAHDVIIVGGGLAGCAAAITLSRGGRRVLLLEAGRYPRQKVCGEFVSAEALPFLGRLLGSESDDLISAAPVIDRVRFLRAGRAAQAPVAPQARSISRAVLDHALWGAAIGAGAEVRDGTSVIGVERVDGALVVRTGAAEHPGRHVIDASGRWSRLRQQPANELSGGLGLKAHFAGEPTPGAVELYFFDGGYCGVQVAAQGELNVCALVDPRRARTLAEVFDAHPELRARSRDWESRGEALATAPVLMRRPKPLAEGVLRVGDAAGFLEPLFGDGISVALRSGELAAECLLDGADYAASYRARFLRAFRGAALARGVFAAPRPFRSVLWRLLEGRPWWIASLSRLSR